MSYINPKKTEYYIVGDKKYRIDRMTTDRIVNVLEWIERNARNLIIKKIHKKYRWSRHESDTEKSCESLIMKISLMTNQEFYETYYPVYFDLLNELKKRELKRVLGKID